MTTAHVPDSVVIARPDQDAMQRGATSALAMVQAFEVTDDATYGLAADELSAIKRKASQLDEQRKAITKPLDDAKAAVMALFRGPLELLSQAEGAIKSKMLAYSTEQRRIADAARMQAERAAQAERDRLAREAAELAAQGRTGEAAIKEQVAQMVVAPPAAVPAPVKAKGIAVRTTLDVRVTDLLALVQHVAKHPELIDMIEPAMPRLRAYGKGLGTRCNLPGVTVVEVESIAARK
jgi:hypothetical protein